MFINSSIYDRFEIQNDLPFRRRITCWFIQIVLMLTLGKISPLFHLLFIFAFTQI